MTKISALRAASKDWTEFWAYLEYFAESSAAKHSEEVELVELAWGLMHLLGCKCGGPGRTLLGSHHSMLVVLGELVPVVLVVSGSGCALGEVVGVVALFFR